MNRLLVVRVTITVLVLGFWAVFLRQGYGGTWGIGDVPVAGQPYIGSIGPDPYFGAPLPAGVALGDRFDRRGIPLPQRIELGLATPDVGSRVTLTLQHGKATKLVTLVAKPTPPLLPIDWALVVLQVLYTLLGLLLLWRGRDWVAWGLAMFALAFTMKEICAYASPMAGKEWVVLTLRIARDLGLFLAVLQLSRDALLRRTRKILIGSMLAIAAIYAFGTSHRYLSYVLAARASWVSDSIDYLMSVAAGVCVLTLALGYRRSGESSRLRMRWILVAVSLHFAAFALWEVPPLWMAISLAFAAIAAFAYGALRHKLVDVSFAVSRTLVYGGVVALVIGVFAILEHAIASRAMGEEAGIALHLLVPLVLGIALHQVRERIEHVIERLFFRRQFEAERALLKLAHESAYMETDKALGARVVDDVMTHIGPEGVAIYRRVDGGYACVAQAGQAAWADSIGPDDPAFVALRAGVDEQALSPIRTLLGAHGIAFPMCVAGRLQGALVCADRPQQYTPDERQVLRRVAHEVGAAWQALEARESQRLLEALAHGRIAMRDVRARVLSSSTG